MTAFLLIYFEQIVFFLCNDLYNSAILQMNNKAKKNYSRTASDASDWIHVGTFIVQTFPKQTCKKRMN